ncbi:MAG: flagellar export chaperone FlgN [Anaerovoracaceae bacterium]
MEAFGKFVDLMEEYDELLTELLEIEDDKIHAISHEELDLLNECIRDEEAGMLKMKGLDMRRDAITEEIGYVGKTFRQILEVVAADYRDELQPLFNSISEKTRRLKDISDSVRNMIESKMILNKSMIESLNNQSGGIYDKNGSLVQDFSGTRDTSI